MSLLYLDFPLSLFSGAYIGVGASLLAVSVVMVIAGVATCFYAFKYGSKASDQRRQVSLFTSVLFTKTTVWSKSCKFSSE